VQLGSGIPESDGPVITTSGRAFDNEKRNLVDVRHTICLRERHRGDTVIVMPRLVILSVKRSSLRGK
jgi:hypothetical protein